ncbi:glucosaminidase domain-containing protein [Paenibacillus sp. FSL R7-0345]|uniref:glycoside hydrolase family 73 protein n=1 Tax=Paenibacillus sp. FSL R7-0345 TaxID=2954535 RepID=UPI00315ABFBF
MSKKYTKTAFFKLLIPTVIQVRCEGSEILPSVRLAQNWLETGGTINSWNNLGGYKVGSGAATPFWNGSSVNTKTWEVYDGVKVNTSANWRAYSSIYNFYKDQDLLFGKTRYDRVREAMTPEDQTAALYKCGYATDPDYASKLMSIIQSNILTQYDVQAEEAEELRVEERKRIEKLEAAVAALTKSKDTLKEGYTRQEATFKDQANQIKELSTTLLGLTDTSPPVWAEDALQAFANTPSVLNGSPVMDTPHKATYTEARLITILYRLGLAAMQNGGE